MRTIATAGHVDHGKSSLVLALTGTDPDRWAEEKQRGMTIDLGFAFTRLDSGQEIGFVDVPGHVRFLKNMLAGVGSIDIALLVVAANEGWMPQSEEHLLVLELLGVSHGVVALSKADTTDAATATATRRQIEDRLAASPFSHAPIVLCDAKTGRGISEVRAALDDTVKLAAAPVDWGRPRLWVDRAFSAQGVGTIVTGTLTRGRLAIGTEVLVGSPPRTARVRGIECAGVACDQAAPGSRVAINLVGIEYKSITRGDALVTDEQWARPRVVDIALTPSGETKPLSRRGLLQAYIGSGEYEVNFRPIKSDSRFARIGLSGALPLAVGDRLILRDPGTESTVAGAEIIDLDPITKMSEAAYQLALPLPERALVRYPWLTLDDLVALTGTNTHHAQAVCTTLVEQNLGVAVAGWVVRPETLAAIQRRATEKITSHYQEFPHSSGLNINAMAKELGITTDQARAALSTMPELEINQGQLRDRKHSDGATSPAAQELISTLTATPFAPPAPSQLAVAPELIQTLLRTGQLIDLDGIIFSAGALAQARQIVVDEFKTKEQLTVADVRNLLGSTRKYVLPIVTWLDRTGVTRRRGDQRIAGPTSGLTK